MARQTGARARDDSDLHDGPETPSQGGASGGGTARDLGSRDEYKSATGGDPMRTGVHKQDHVQPRTRTRADHEGS